MAFEPQEWKTGDKYPADRLTELEKVVVAKAAKGDKGDKGETGAPGKDGAKGEKGDPGKDATPQFTADEVAKIKDLIAPHAEG
jgi:hypothetical protein